MGRASATGVVSANTAAAPRTTRAVRNTLVNTTPPSTWAASAAVGTKVDSGPKPALARDQTDACSAYVLVRESSQANTSRAFSFGGKTG